MHPQTIEPIKSLTPPLEEIAMVLVVDNSGQRRPLTEAERMERAASWGYRQAVLDQTSLEGIDPLDKLRLFRWFCALIMQSNPATDGVIGYKVPPLKS